MSLRAVAPALAIAALTCTALPTVAQRPAGEVIAPRVDLLAARQGGIPKIQLLVRESWITLPSGTYRSPDGASITVQDGEIRSMTGSSGRSAEFSVSKIDAVALRMQSPKLVLLDARGRTTALPDGRFVSGDGTTLVVRDGAIVGFGTGR